MTAKKDVALPESRALSLLPPSNFFIVCDLNTHSVFGPFNALQEAQYKAAEVAATVRGPKPVGVFKYVGGVTSEHKPLYWTDASE